MYELNGKEWRLDGEPGWTMREVKDALEKGSGIPWFLQRLFVETEEPQDEVVLASLHTQGRATCNLIVKCPEKFFSEKYGADMSSAHLNLRGVHLCDEGAKALAEASPIPPPAPVTQAIFPSSDPMAFSCFVRCIRTEKVTEAGFCPLDVFRPRGSVFG